MLLLSLLLLLLILLLLSQIPQVELPTDAVQHAAWKGDAGCASLVGRGQLRPYCGRGRLVAVAVSGDRWHSQIDSRIRVAFHFFCPAQRGRKRSLNLLFLAGLPRTILLSAIIFSSFSLAARCPREGCRHNNFSVVMCMTHIASNERYF